MSLLNPRIQKQNLILESLHQEITEKYDYSEDFPSEEEAKSFIKYNKDILFHDIEYLRNGDCRVHYDLKSDINQPLIPGAWGKSKSHNESWVKKNMDKIKGMELYAIVFKNGNLFQPVTYYLYEEDAEKRIKEINKRREGLNLEVRGFRL